MSILLQDLTKRFGPHTAVDHVSLEIEDGELFVLLGPSGSGKSTILRLIAGLTPVDCGRIFLHGRDVTDLPPQKRNTGFVFQNYSLFRHLTVAQNIEFGLEIRKVPAPQRAARRDELLDLVGLAGFGERYPHQLSGGQQQRVAVARALAFEPSVLLLDEPFGALDVKIRAQLRKTLKAIQRKLRVTTILVTHDQEEAFELADRIGVIERGRLLEVGPPAQLYRHPQHEFVATFLGGANLLAGQCTDGHVRVGPLTLPVPGPLSLRDEEGRAEVLFRPESLTLARTREELAVPVLGQGTIEEVLFLGTLQRVQVRVQPLPGTWPLATEYGEAGVPLQVALLSHSDNQHDFGVGQTVWVGIKDFHLLPRIALRLLVCADPSADAAQTARLALVLAKATASPVTVLGVGESEEAARKALAPLHAYLSAQIQQLTTKTRHGVPAEELVREAREGEYDLAIVGGQPAGNHARRPGVTAERVARESPIPVLVVKGERPAIRRVLLCTAGGEPGKLDIVFGGRLARRTGAAATLLHIEAPLPSNGAAPAVIAGRAVATAPQTRVWIERHLEHGLRTLLNQGIRAEAKVRHGAVLDEILAEATEGDYDLLVIGGHQEGAAYRPVRPDLASEIVRLADRPVLVVRGMLDR